MAKIRRRFLLILFFLSAIALLTIGTLFLDQLACEGQLFNDNLPPTPAQQILKERLIGQSFVAPRAGLNRIDLFLQTYGRRNSHDILLQLLEIPATVDDPLKGMVVFTTTFKATTVKDQRWHTFTFPKIPDSAWKEYLITLQSPASEDGNAITVGGIQQDVYSPGLAVVYAPDLGFSALTPVPGDIMFRTCYEMTTLEKLQLFSAQLTEKRPALWGRVGFYLVSLSLYIVLLIGFFWRLGSIK